MRDRAIMWTLAGWLIGGWVSTALAGGVLPDLRVEVLDSGGGTASAALGTHEDRDGNALAIVGTVTIGATDLPAFWEPDASGAFVLTLLPDIGGNGGTADAVVVDVSDFGVVASGTVVDGSGVTQPCAWSRDMPTDPFLLTVLDTTGNGGRATSVARLDDGGLGVGPTTVIGIGGHVFGAGGVTGASVWTSTAGGPFMRTPLGGLSGGGPNSSVIDLTALGGDWLAVGMAQNPAAVERAVRWTNSANVWGDATLFPLPMSSGAARATGVTRTTANGSMAAACGRVVVAGGATHAFQWTFDGVDWTGLDLGTTSGVTDSSSQDLTLRNGAGAALIVGRSESGMALDDGVATVWAPAAMMPVPIDLNTLVTGLPVGLTLRRANHIADRTVTPFGTGDFQIVGVATSAGPGPSQPQAVFLTDGPVPRPLIVPAGVGVAGGNGSLTEDVILHGTSGSTVGYSVGVTVCNLGTAQAAWNINTDQHPVFAQNMYRLMNGRLEQIGQSWLKHGFAVLDETYCGGTCNETTDLFNLGVGCSDPYSAMLNANVTLLRSKTGVNPVNGTIAPWPDFVEPTGPLPGLLQVPQDTLIPSADPANPRYFLEVQVLHPVSPSTRGYREVDVLAGNELDIAAYTTQAGLPLDHEVNWDATNADAETGWTTLYCKALSLGKGLWRYEYALHNEALVDGLGAVAVPVDASVTVSATGFSDVSYHSGDPFDGTDWPAVVAGGAVTWATTPAGTDPNANALRWGTVYNFWFEADVPPANGAVTAEVFDPGLGNPTSVSYAAVVPGSGCTALGCADTDLNGVRDDACLWWECVAEAGTSTALTAFADVGGSFGACPPDGFANIHDRNHALVCFTGTSSCADVNLDAGGSFGACEPDGFCNIHDANHALNAFSNNTTCMCPGGPAPDLPPVIAGRAQLRLARRTAEPVTPGATIAVDVFVDGPTAPIRSYQLEVGVTGGVRGTLELVDVAVEPRRDAVFNGRRDSFQATNLERAALMSGLEANEGVTLTKSAYLATYTYRVSADAAGAFVFDVVEVDTAQTCLVAPPEHHIVIDGSQPAMVEIRGRSRRRAR